MDLPSTLLVPLSAPGISPRTLPGGRCAQGRLPSPADVPRPDNTHPETLAYQERVAACSTPNPQTKAVGVSIILGAAHANSIPRILSTRGVFFARRATSRAGG